MKKRIVISSLFVIGLMLTLILVVADSQGVYELAKEEEDVLTDIGTINLPVGTLIGELDDSTVDVILKETREMQTTEGPMVFEIGAEIDCPEPTPGYPNNCDPL